MKNTTKTITMNIAGTALVAAGAGSIAFAGTAAAAPSAEVVDNCYTIVSTVSTVGAPSAIGNAHFGLGTAAVRDGKLTAFGETAPIGADGAVTIRGQRAVLSVAPGQEGSPEPSYTVRGVPGVRALYPIC